MTRKTILVLATVALVACSGPSIADMMRDAADQLDSTAMAMPIEGTYPCDQTTARTVDSGTSRVTTTFFYAEMNDPHIAPDFSYVQAIGCDRVLVGNDPNEPTCPAGAACTGSNAPVLSCTTLPSIQIQTGRARVLCGTATTVDPDSGGGMPPVQNGERWMSVRVRVD